MNTEIVPIILTGGWGPGETERPLRRAHQAAARDLIETLLSTEYVRRAIVATDNPAWGHTLSDLPVDVIPDDSSRSFHFGQRLASLIEHDSPPCVLYAGGGSAPLMSRQSWARILDELAQADRAVIANNLHSCDWVGFTPTAEAVSAIAQETSDNGLAWVLTYEIGLPATSLPASAATRFDLDTPIDLLIARHHSGVGPHLRSYLEGLDWPAPQLNQVLDEMRREGGSLAVVGRVSASAWSALEQATRCWVRVFAEERGMRASGRQKRGEVKSLLADYLEVVGVEAFFDGLADLVDGVLFDNRVILAARAIWPSTSDRFNADLLRWPQVKEPFLRQFTRAAAEARLPVVLGGHSVVSGGLMALVEAIKTPANGPGNAGQQERK